MLVNYHLDARLAALAKKLDAVYTRYADDMTFSLAEDNAKTIHMLIRLSKHVAQQNGYVLHQRRKLHIRRRHDRQLAGWKSLCAMVARQAGTTK